MSNPVIIGLAAPPLTGKSSIRRALARQLRGGSDRPWLVMDNELGFSMPARVLCAEASGLTLNSPEFARKFNLRFQLDYQEACRDLALTNNINVVMPGPFENLTSQIPVSEEKKIPLFEKMRDIDFGQFNFHVVQMILMPEETTGITPDNVIGHPAMRPIEEEIQRRRIARGEGNPHQQALDADKADSTYYGKRVRMILETFEAFPNHIKKLHVTLGESPSSVAKRLADVIMYVSG